MKFLKLCALSICAFALVGQSAWARKKHPLPMRSYQAFMSARQLRAQTTKVPYYGGPVVGSVKVNVVFWGNDLSPAFQKSLVDFYQAIVHSDYIDQLSEFSTNTTSTTGAPGTHQTITRGSVGSVVAIQPKNPARSLSQKDIENELETQFEAGALPKPSADSLYMIYFPGGYDIEISFGHSCSAWMADHEGFSSSRFGNVYYAMFPCDTSSPNQFNDLTEASSHELAEAITDPLSPLANTTPAAPAAWITANLDEIADLCAWDRTSLVSTAGVTYAVQKLWLNSIEGCSPASFKASFR